MAETLTSFKFRVQTASITLLIMLVFCILVIKGFFLITGEHIADMVKRCYNKA